MTLTLHPIMYLAEGPIFDPSAPGTHVIQYEVIGLPAKRGALIRKKDGHWQVLRVRDNLPDAWRGEFPSAEAALHALASDPGA